ncbi:MAG: hypothetical protein RR050_03250 [Bacilli bacterium]
MYNESINVLKTIEKNGFKAYVVGGFVRDKYLNRSSNDVDICTNATPKELKEIFERVILKAVKYGSVSVIQNKIRFEITTFRKDIGYLDNRIPKKVKYISNLSDDLKRRDFTINTICLDSSGNTIDLLGGIKDINNKVIKMIGNPKYRLKEDSLRILRAIRFATILDFELDSKLRIYIIKYGYLLKKLSYYHKKEELEKIFSSSNALKGINLIKELCLASYLDLKNINNIVITSSIIGIWAQLNVIDIYEFSSNEKELIKNINELSNKNILENYNLYHYGLYVSLIVGEIKNIDKKMIVLSYDLLPIKIRKDICISGKEISKLLNKKEGIYLKNIITDLEINILNNNLNNNLEEITKYILNK